MSIEQIFRIYELINGHSPAIRFESTNEGAITQTFLSLKSHDPDKFILRKEYRINPEELEIQNPVDLLSMTKEKAEYKKEFKEEVGKKFDSNKPMVGTIIRVFPRALMAIGAVIRFGAKKYPNPNNWKMNEDIINRYFDSAIRHMSKHFAGYEKDEETGLPHLVHAAWNMLAILEKYLMEHPEISKDIMFPKEIKD